MLAATAFSLLVPAFDREGIGAVLIGFAVGAAVIVALDVWVPHLHAQWREGGREPVTQSTQLNRVTLLMIAMTIHNFPEGAAVGTAFAAGGRNGARAATGRRHRHPERAGGLRGCAPLVAVGASRATAVLLALASGAIEPVAAFGAFGAFGLFSALLPYGLAFAAAAMLCVVVDEVIPESHAHGHERDASIALIAGFALMMTLDSALG